MTAEFGYKTPTGRIVLNDGGLIQKFEAHLEAATNAYPGRLMIRGTTDNDVKVADGLHPVAGVLGYEHAGIGDRVASITTIYPVDANVPILKGHFPLYIPSGLTAGTYLTKDDAVVTWIDGKVVPGYVSGGKVAIKVPFKDSSGNPASTGIVFPAGMRITDCLVECTAGNGAYTISVGFPTGESGSATGFLNAESLAALGFATHNLVDGTVGNITLGSYLAEDTIRADSSGNYAAIRKTYLTDGTSKTLSYTTTAHPTLAGYIYIFVESPGVELLGKALATIDATLATKGVFVDVLEV